MLRDHATEPESPVIATSAAELFCGMKVSTALRTFQAGVVVFEEGAEPAYIYRLLRGVVKLIELDSKGNPVLIGYRTAGWPIGTADALARRPHQCRAETATVCSFDVVATKAFTSAVACSHSLALAALDLSTLEAAQQVSEARSAESARDKVVRALGMAAAIAHTNMAGLDVGSRGPRSGRAISQASLAEFVGIAPETFSRIRATLERNRVAGRRARRRDFVQPDLISHH